jgi:DNA polymerase-3 subunit beta
LVATDGHRLAKIHQAIACESDQQLLMPRESVLELKKLLKDEGTCTVQVGSRQIQVTMVNGLSFSTTLIDGKFPDYERVIPRTLTRSVRVDRVLLTDAVNRVGLVLDKAQQGLALAFGENTLTLQAKARDEDAEEVLEIEYSDTSLIIGINQTYLLEVLKTLMSETVHLQFSGADNPLKIESVENDEGVYVIMPMRL